MKTHRIRQPLFRLLRYLSVGLFSVFLPVSAFANVPTFEEAFRRELRELTATRDALSQSLEKTIHEADEQKQELTQKISQTLHDLESLQKQQRQLEQTREVAFESAQKTTDENALFDAMLHTATESATASSGRHSLNASQNEIFSNCMTTAISTLKQHGLVVSEKATYFSTDAREISGTVVRIGNIAALGLEKGKGNILSRTSQGELMAVGEISAGAVKALKEGKRIGPILISPFPKGASIQDSKKNLWQTAEAGGPVAFVILAIAALGILLVLERIGTLLMHSDYVPSSFNKVSVLIAENRFQDAQKLSRRMGAAGKGIRYVIENRKLEREEMENGVDELVFRTLPKMDRSLTILTVITTATPLLGLLGTVTGMISTFDVITRYGTGNPALLSGGISEALITTEIGLAVAIPFLLARSLIAKWARKIMDNMQIYCLAAMNVLKKGEHV